MKKAFRFILLTASTALGLGASGAFAQSSLYSVGKAVNTFAPTTFTINRTTGEGTAVGAIGSQSADLFGLAVAGGVLYTFDGATDTIRRVSPQTGAFTGAPLSLTLNSQPLLLMGEGDLAFSLDGLTGYLTAANNIGATKTPTLYRFSLSTGVATQIGITRDSVGPITVDGMAFNPTTGILYAITDEDTQLYTLNITAGANGGFLTPVNDLGVAPNSGFGALTFDNQTLYGVINSSLYTISTTPNATNSATPIPSSGFGTDFGSISGLAVVVPEPGSALLLAVGTAGMLAARRRKTA